MCYLYKHNIEIRHFVSWFLKAQSDILWCLEHFWKKERNRSLVWNMPFFPFQTKTKTGTFQLITNVAKGTNNCSSFTKRRGHEFLASVVFIIKECCVAWKILRHLIEACKWVLWEKIAPWVSHYHPRWIRPKSFFGIIRFSMQSLPRCSMMY